MHIVIIGNGVAGITAARFLRKGSDADITVVSDEAPFHFSRPAMMYVSMGQLTFAHTKPYEDWFWSKNRIGLRSGKVLALRPHLTGISVAFDDGTELEATHVILATGSVAALPEWSGRTLRGVQTYVHAGDLDRLEENLKGARHGVVIGGGLIGVEAAEVLHARGVQTTFLIRESAMYRKVFPELEAQWITKHIADHGIHVACGVEVASLHARADDATRVGMVRTTSGMDIQADIVVVATGVRPRVELAMASGVAVARGIVVDDRFRTSVPNVFAIGDCAELPTGVQQLWYTARQHGEHVASVILGRDRPYDGGVYFNSAKFFDLEWQVYGHVPATSGADDSFVWTDEPHQRCLRIAHRDGRVIGIHGIGVRLRQETCTQWIEQGAMIHDVRRTIRRAIFDPELSRPITI